MKRLWIFALPILLALGCAPAEPPDASEAAGTPVIFISIDTLRADHLPAYGYAGVKTPALDTLRRDGVLFKRAYSHYPLTLPAHVSVLSGLLPPEHGVRDNLGYDVELTEDAPYLPRILQAAGYTTGAAVSSYVLRPETGIDAHFDFYDANIEVLDTDRAEGLGEVQRTGDATLAVAVDWLDEMPSEEEGTKPFFLFLHLYEPHTPYAPPEPYASRYANPYDGEIAAADAIIGRFLDALRQRGIYDQALILLFSDHGEGLGDHGEEEHGLLLYREALEVPLIVKLPGGARSGQTSDTPAQLIDLTPTVLDVLSLPTPERLRGASLLKLMESPPASRPIYAETFYPRLHMGWSELTSLIDGEYHYIEGPDPELYDLAQDRPQQRNVLRDQRLAYRDLRDTLANLKRPLKPPSEVDSETRQRLETLGYLSASGGSQEGPLPDPKSRIHLLAALGEALRLVDRESFAEAIPQLEALLDKNPGMQDGWQALATSYRRTGRYTEALAAYQNQLEFLGPRSHIALGLAELYLQLGQLQAAADHAELAVREDPAGAYLKLSEVALVRGDLETAERHAQNSVEARGLAVAPLINLAKIQVHQNQLDATRQLLARIDQEMRRRPDPKPMANLHFVRGELLAREGDTEAGLQAFEAEIEDHPENLDAYARLVFLHTALGRPEEATRLLRTMVEKSPSPAAYAAAVKTLRLLGDERQAAALLSYALGLFPQAEALQALSLEP